VKTVTKGEGQLKRICPTGDAGERAFVSGIVLAAGTSRRMGQSKPLLLLDGRTLLQHVVDHALASCLDEVVVVLGHEAEAVRASLGSRPDPALRWALNPRYEEGQARSLAAGLAAADPRAHAAAVLLADQPGVEPALIDRIVGAFRESEWPALRAGYRGGSGDRQGDTPDLLPAHPVVLDRSLWPALQALEGDEGARGFLQRHADWLHTLPLAGHSPPDIDTPEDYQRVRDARHSPD